jgi:hypothetical protein
MDLPSLAVILQAALSPNPQERKAAEESLNQVGAFIFIMYFIQDNGHMCILRLSDCIGGAGDCLPH